MSDLSCYACDVPIRESDDRAIARTRDQDAELEKLPFDQMEEYAHYLGLVHCMPVPWHVTSDGRIIVCKACHAKTLVRVTGKIQASEGLLEWVWSELNDALASMLSDYPHRGFAGDDAFDDYKGAIAMLGVLAGTYFDTDLTNFAEWLAEGPQYADDPRHALIEMTGEDAFDEDAMARVLASNSVAG